MRQRNCTTGRIAMETMLFGSHPRPRRRARLVRAAALWSALRRVVRGAASAQQIRVTGLVSTQGGSPVRGAQVRVAGTDVAALTNDAGRYTIQAPTSGQLIVTQLGFKPVRVDVNSRTTIDVTLERIAVLEQMVVTGYTEQRRSEITGAVATVDTAAVQRQTGASVLQRLAANAPGVTVEANGSPGSRSTVRIRGISSFQNNDPLYIVDGVPARADADRKSTRLN